MVRLGYRLPEPRCDSARFVVTVTLLVPGPDFRAQNHLQGLSCGRFETYPIVSGRSTINVLDPLSP